MDLDEYISKLKSESATPGGGSASAITSMFSASLNSMAALLSMGKKKLEAYNKDFENISSNAGETIEKLKRLSQEDEDSFRGIMDALHMDRKNPERRPALDIAIKKSVYVSWRIAGISMYNLNNSFFLCKYGNKNLITDSISAGYMSYTSIHTSVNNIKINLKLLKDVEYRYGEQVKLKLFMETVEETMTAIKTMENEL
jgi:formiminotetrahydrofolate cyclodeaminase